MTGLEGFEPVAPVVHLPPAAGLGRRRPPGACLSRRSALGAFTCTRCKRRVCPCFDASTEDEALCDDCWIHLAGDEELPTCG